MPQVIPFFIAVGQAAAGAIVSTVTFGAAGAGLTAAAASTLSGMAITAATANTVLAAGAALGKVALAAGLSALSKPKVPPYTNQLSGQKSSIGSRSILMGRTAVGGTMNTDWMTTERKNRISSCVYTLSHVGKSGVVEAVVWGQDTVTFGAANGSGIQAAVGKYAGAMWIVQRPGEWNQSAININSGGNGLWANVHPSEWRSTDKCLGCLTVMIVIKNDEEVYKENSHNPIFVTNANLVELIDPRTGATANTVAQKRNPWVWAYSWAQQWLSPTGLLIAGIGLTAGAHIDASSFAYAANIADNNSWAIGGEIKIDPSNAFNDLRNISQAGGGDVTFRNGKLTAIVSAPMSISAVITEDDLRAKPSWQSAVETSQLPNRITPRFISEANLWQAVDGTVVTNADFVTQQNGRKITTNLDLPYIGNGAEQAGKLAAYGLVNAREPFKWSLQLKPQARFIGSNGDCVQLNLPNTGFSAHSIVITKITYNNDLSIDIEGITETTSKHAWALGQTTTPPDYSAISPYDLNNSEKPDTGQWTATAETISANGTTLPIIRVTGSASDFLAAKGIIIRYRQNVIGSNWLDGFYYQRDATQSEIHGVTPNTSYIVGISYVNINDKESEILEIPAVTTGTMVAGSAASVDWTGITQRPPNLLTPDLQNANAGFDIYTTATGVPDNWNNWLNGSFASRVSDGLGGYAMRLYSNGGDNVGIRQAITSLTGDTYIVLTARVKLIAGTLLGAGVVFNHNTAGGTWLSDSIINFATDVDSTGATIGSGVVGTTYNFTKIVKTPATSAQGIIYACSHNSALGNITAANTLQWLECGWAYATQSEIYTLLANARINDILSDSVISAGQEKVDINALMARLAGEYSRISAKAATLGVSYTAYQTAYNNWSNVVNSITNITNTTVDSVGVNSTALNNYLLAYNNAKVDLENSIQATQANLMRVNTNLCQNPSGALGLRGWTGNGNWYVQTESGWGDVPYFAIQHGSNTTGSVWLQKTIPCVPGLVLSTQAKIINAGLSPTAKFNMYIQWLNASGTWFASTPLVNTGMVGSDGWILLKLENQIAPNNTAYARLTLHVDGDGTWSNTFVAFREVKLERGSICTIYTADSSQVLQNRLNDILSDGIITAGQEKVDALAFRDRIIIEYGHKTAQATSFGLTYAAYTASYNNYINYFNSLSNVSNTTVDTAINRTTYNNYLWSYTSDLQDLENAIAGKASTLSTWSGVTGTGRPEDNADVTLNAQISIDGLLATTFDFSGGSVTSGQLPRNIQARAFRGGTEVTTGGTWSITNMVNCTVSVNASTGVESITALEGGGQIERSYVRQFTYNGKLSGQQKVTINYNNTDTATVTSKAGVPSTFGSTINRNVWSSIATNGVMSISDCPANSVVTISGGFGYENPVGNCSINLRLKIDGVVVYTGFAQEVSSGGLTVSADWSELFNYKHTALLSAGTHTFSVEAQRTSGTGSVSTNGNLFVTVTKT